MSIKLRERLNYLHPDLIKVLEEEAELAEIDAGQEILREGQYVKIIPIVIEGIVRVFMRYEDKELLLYYINVGESCVMSFAAGMNNDKSRIHAVAESDTTILLLPVDRVRIWLKEFHSLNDLFYNQYNTRYMDVVETIGKVIFTKLDVRLLEHLKTLSTMRGSDYVQISHQQLANELGTAREVVSRLLKKLEREGSVELSSNGIKVF